MIKKVSTLLFLLFLLSPRGQAAGSESATASWSSSKSFHGIPGRASGTIVFYVNSKNRSFTCAFSGNGQVSGTAQIFGAAQTINGTVSFSQSSCGGTFNPEQGTVDGSISLTGSYRSSATWQDDEGQSRTETDSGSETHSGSIYGTLFEGGRGEVNAGEFSAEWVVNRALSRREPPPGEEEPPGDSYEDVREPPSREPPSRVPPSRVAPSRVAPGEDRGMEEPALEPDDDAEEPEPETREDDPAFKEYVDNSLELTNTLADQYKAYKDGGGRLSFSGFVKRQYPDPGQRADVEQAIQVASIEKERREKEVEAYSHEAEHIAMDMLTSYNNDMAKMVELGQQPVDINTYLEQKAESPEQKDIVKQAMTFFSVDGYETARESYNAMVDTMKSEVSGVTKIFKGAASGPGDTHAQWLAQKTYDVAQGTFLAKAKSMLPEKLVENADAFYGQYQGMSEKYDTVKELTAAKQKFNERNKKLFEAHREGKLETEGVQAMRGLNVLNAAVESKLMPDFGGMVDYWKEGFGNAIQFSGDFLVHKTSVLQLQPDMDDKAIANYEDSRKDLKKYAKGEKEKPYDNTNTFYKLWDSVSPWSKRESKPEHKKYH